MISIKWSKQFCSEPLENIENYDKAVADKEHMWECHHIAEILPCGSYSREDLKKVGLYWKRPASELVYLRHDEHRALHAKNRKPETSRRIAEKVAMRNRGRKASAETRRRLSLSHMGKHPSPSAELKRIASLKKRYETQERAGSKRVEMKRMDGTLVIEFASPRRAVEWLRENGYPKASKGNIKACACGLMKRCYKAYWRYI